MDGDKHSVTFVGDRYQPWIGSPVQAPNMPIILLIVSTLAFWTLYWFVQMGGIQHFQNQKAKRKEEARGRRRESARASRRCEPWTTRATRSRS